MQTTSDFESKLTLSTIKLVLGLIPIYLLIEIQQSSFSLSFWVVLSVFVLSLLSHQLINSNQRKIGITLFFTIITLAVYITVAQPDRVKSPSVAAVYILTVLYALVYQKRGLMISSLSNFVYFGLIFFIYSLTNNFFQLNDIRVLILEIMMQMTTSLVVYLMLHRHNTMTNTLNNKLRENEALLKYSIDGYIITDTDFKITFKSDHFSDLAARIEGSISDNLYQSLSTLCENNIDQFFLEVQDSGQSQVILTFALAQENIETIQLEQDIHLECFGHKQDEDRFLFVFVDQTSRVHQQLKQKQLDEIMNEKQKIEVVQQISGAIAHDFNNILTTIIAQCDLIAMNPELSDTITKDVLKIKESALRASNSSHRLLSFSKASNFKPEIVCINDYLEDNKIILQKIAGKRARIIFENKTTYTDVFIDPIHLEQLILNLVINAIEASNLGNDVLVTTEQCSRITLVEKYTNLNHQPMFDYIEVRISNHGNIDESLLDQIFEPFYTTKETGTGLGLAIISSIIKKYQGDIVFTNQDNKTIVSFVLPLMEKQTNKVSTRKLPTNFIYPFLSILIVDDDIDLLLTLAKMMRKTHNFSVETAETAEIASIKFDHSDFDIIICDQVLDRMSGIEFYQKVRKQDKDIRFILMSGYNIKMDPKEYSDPNFEFINKPFSKDKLLDLINSFENLQPKKV